MNKGILKLATTFVVLSLHMSHGFLPNHHQQKPCFLSTFSSAIRWTVLDPCIMLSSDEATMLEDWEIPEQITLPSVPPLLLLQDANDPLPPQQLGTVRCVILSDTHGRHNQLPSLPPGDVLMHLGDVANRGSLEDIRSFCYYLQQQPHPDKVLLEGNHDRDLKTPNLINLEREYAGMAGARLVKDDIISVADGRLRLFGASWDTCEWDDFDFLLPGDEAVAVGDDDVAFDFLLTHINPKTRLGGHGWEGSKKLAQIVQYHQIPLHLFGHIHWGRGIQQQSPSNSVMVNCSTSWNQPVVVDWDPASKRVVMVHCPCPKVVECNGRLVVVDDSI
jgi:calcineurin-like phosphoesterase family protein